VAQVQPVVTHTEVKVIRRFAQVLIALACGWSGLAGAATVYFTSPGFNGGSFPAPASFTVAASAEATADYERISSLVLFKDGVQVASGSGTLMTKSVSYSATALPAGTYYFVARSTNSSNQTTSKTIAVTVTPGNAAPSVQLGAITGAPFIAPATLGLTASASDSDGSIAKVEFFSNDQLLATVTTAPYSYSWAGVAPGTYSITARATDNLGATAMSASSATVNPSRVIGNFEGVSSDATYAYLGGWACSTGLDQPIDVHVYAGAGWPSGTIVTGGTANRPSEPAVAASCQAGGTAYRFSIPVDNNLRAQFAGKPLYIHGISPVGQANDLIGGSGNFTMPPPPATKIAAFVGQTVPTTVLKGAVFPVSLQFRNDGTAVWRIADGYRLGAQNPANNAIWGVSRAGLAADVAGGGTANVQFNATAPSTDGTYAFQWQMLQENVEWFGAASTNVAVRVVSGSISADPTRCAIPYGGTYCATTLAWSSSAPDAEVWKTDANDAGEQLVTRGQSGQLLVSTITTATSRYKLKAAGLILATVDVAGVPTQNASPNVTITSPRPGAQGNAPAQLTIRASATDADDGVASVEFYVNGSLRCTDTIAPYECPWPDVAMGSYPLYAIARDTRGAATASASVTISVGANAAPSVQLTAPATGMTASAPAAVDLTASASDSDGSIANVDFYVGSTLVGSDTTSPYTARWSATQAGTYSLTAVAKDNGGQTATSAVVSVTIRANVAPSVQLTAPMSGGQGTAPTTVIVAAAATDSDGSIASVDFFAGTTLLGTDATAPYSVTWSASQPGTYNLTAVARDNGAATTTSQPVSASIAAPEPARPVSIPVATPVVRTYVYDSAQRLCKVIEPESGATVLDYDGAGNVIWSSSGHAGLTSTTSCDRDNSQVLARRVIRSYDTRNRLKTLLFPDGKGNQVWNYTLAGQPESVTTYNANGTDIVRNTYANYQNGLLKGETQEQGGYSWSVGYGYDRLGNRASIVYPAGLTVTYEPNALGQPTRVTGNTTVLASGFSYYPNGAAREFTYGNGVVHSMQQNARQLPATVTSSRGVASLAYAYDPNGNVLSIRDYQRGTTYDRTMQYDDLNRLTAAGSCALQGDCWQRFTYDAVDNIRSWKAADVKDYAEYYYDARQRLTNIRNSSGAAVVGLDYDDQGNLSNKNGRTYTFDYGNRLRTALGTDTYWYDAYGRRALAATSKGKGYSLYGADGSLLWERDERVDGRLQYVYLNGTLLATRRRTIESDAEAIYYDHTDALGSVIALTDSTGAVVERSEYDAYGGLMNRPSSNRPGYTGHVMDSATGLTYMQQRYYDPQIGRFLSADPIRVDGAAGGNFNRYWYANNNPYRFMDPDGRQACVCTPEALWAQLGRAFNHGVDTTEQAVAKKLDESDIRAQLDVAKAGVALSIDQSLLHGDGKVTFSMLAFDKHKASGEGYFVGIFAQKREPFVLAEGAKPAGKPGYIPSMVLGEYKAGDVIAGGVSFEGNALGRVEATPKVGVGVGEVFKFGEFNTPLTWKGWGNFSRTYEGDAHGR
jgi:RHS repeat-associated protein